MELACAVAKYPALASQSSAAARNGLADCKGVMPDLVAMEPTVYAAVRRLVDLSGMLFTGAIEGDMAELSDAPLRSFALRQSLSAAPGEIGI